MQYIAFAYLEVLSHAVNLFKCYFALWTNDIILTQCETKHQQIDPLGGHKGPPAS